MKRICLLLLIIWTGFGRIQTASAHGLEAGQFSVLLEDVKATITMAPYASAFSFADDNGDGLLSILEVKTHRDAMHALIKERVILQNESGKAAIMLHIDLFVPDETISGEGEHAAADFLQATVRAVWPTVPESVDVEYGLFDSAETPIHYLMQDSDTGQVIEGEFNSAETLVRLRGEGTPAQTGSTIWLSGVEHVLSGYDHILFILALVLATAGLRKLLVPLTTFTIAHTITLAAVAFGFEPPIPAWLIEATIAASIAILAGFYLLKISADVWWVTAILGLIHGLGFGQALTASLGSLQEWGATLIAITIGVELTHLAIAFIGFSALTLLRQSQHDHRLRRLASVAVFCVGMYWTIERIPF